MILLSSQHLSVFSSRDKICWELNMFFLLFCNNKKICHLDVTQIRNFEIKTRKRENQTFREENCFNIPDKQLLLTNLLTYITLCKPLQTFITCTSTIFGLSDICLCRWLFCLFFINFSFGKILNKDYICTNSNCVWSGENSSSGNIYPMSTVTILIHHRWIIIRCQINQL